MTCGQWVAINGHKRGFVEDLFMWTFRTFSFSFILLSWACAARRQGPCLCKAPEPQHKQEENLLLNSLYAYMASLLRRYSSTLENF